MVGLPATPLRSVGFVLSLFLLGCAPNSQQQSQEYRCESGMSIMVTPLDITGNSIKVQLAEEEKALQLSRTPSASGEKYGDGIHAWWAKGAEGMFLVDDTIRYRNCIIVVQ